MFWGDWSRGVTERSFFLIKNRDFSDAEGVAIPGELLLIGDRSQS